MAIVSNNFNRITRSTSTLLAKRALEPDTTSSESTTSTVVMAAMNALGSPAAKKLNANSLTPDKYYPLAAGQFALTPTAAKASRVIYVILNTQTNQRYVGKTEQELRQRLRAHHFGIAHPEKEAGKKTLYEEIRENPQDFQIGILCEVDEEEDIIEREKVCIAEKNAYEEGYNETRGGGAQKTGCGTAVLPEGTPTPKKYYRLDGESLKFEFSPAAKKAKNLVYVIYDKETGKRYVGKTKQELIKRFNSHHSLIAKENADFELYQEMQRRPQDFFAGILYQPPGEKDDLEVLEAYLIEKKSAYEEGYNRTRGTKLNFD